MAGGAAWEEGGVVGCCEDLVSRRDGGRSLVPGRLGLDVWRIWTHWREGRTNEEAAWTGSAKHWSGRSDDELERAGVAKEAEDVGVGRRVDAARRMGEEGGTDRRAGGGVCRDQRSLCDEGGGTVEEEGKGGWRMKKRGGKRVDGLALSGDFKRQQQGEK
ncbi:uncharacterized protein A4U43_C04F11200 [Asparagus officinalis]|uniref:Uncharacterized protein n=1 Tax=Asparagus officinalis TaxID=4686 RepID=A0A5P1EZZ6_ASPOF|nr:uncharacterized protein A4U43_C04F11200 [Asparagus officinalis]